MADSIEDLIRAAFESGAEEIVVRVSRYGADAATPEAFQALVRSRQARIEPTITGCRGNPQAALKAALRERVQSYGPVTAAAPDVDAFG